MILFSRITEEVCYCHCFRHFTATFLRRNDVEIDVIRDYLGHSSSETSAIYIDIDASENLSGMLSFMDKDKGNKQQSNEMDED